MVTLWRNENTLCSCLVMLCQLGGKRDEGRGGILKCTSEHSFACTMSCSRDLRISLAEGKLAPRGDLPGW